jgi:hypothetical protein
LAENVLITASAGDASMLFQRKSTKTVKKILKKEGVRYFSLPLSCQLRLPRGHRFQPVGRLLEAFQALEPDKHVRCEFRAPQIYRRIRDDPLPDLTQA